MISKASNILQDDDFLEDLREKSVVIPTKKTIK